MAFLPSVSEHPWRVQHEQPEGKEEYEKNSIHANWSFITARLDADVDGKDVTILRSRGNIGLWDEKLMHSASWNSGILPKKTESLIDVESVTLGILPY